MSAATADPRANLPTPCADCRGMVERVAVAAGPWQWNDVVGPHAHAVPHPRAGWSLRCSACGCCWTVRLDVWEVAPVYVEQLSVGEYHRQIGSIQYGLPWTETRTTSVVINLFALLSAVLLFAVVVSAYVSTGSPLIAGSPWLLLFGLSAYVHGRELVWLAQG